jgi:hypothetical protein
MSIDSPSETSRPGHARGMMSLQPASYFAREQFNGIVFYMTDHSSLLSVLVTREAVRKIAGEAFPEDEYIDRFEALQSEFEWLASEKFSSGLAEADGSILIEASDVAGAFRPL